MLAPPMLARLALTAAPAVVLAALLADPRRRPARPARVRRARRPGVRQRDQGTEGGPAGCQRLLVAVVRRPQLARPPRRPRRARSGQATRRPRRARRLGELEVGRRAVP